MCVKGAMHSLKQKSTNALHMNDIENIEICYIYIYWYLDFSTISFICIFKIRGIIFIIIQKYFLIFNLIFVLTIYMLIIVHVYFWWDLQCFVGYDETIKEWLAYCLTCINNNLVLKIWGVKFYYELKVFNFNK